MAEDSPETHIWDALSDQEFRRLCRVLMNSPAPQSQILKRFGIGKGQFWRVCAAGRRRQNRKLWAETKQARKCLLDDVRQDALVQRALGGGIKALSRILQLREEKRQKRAEIQAAPPMPNVTITVVPPE